MYYLHYNNPPHSYLPIKIITITGVACTVLIAQKLIDGEFFSILANIELITLSNERSSNAFEGGDWTETKAHSSWQIFKIMAESCGWL